MDISLRLVGAHAVHAVEGASHINAQVNKTVHWGTSLGRTQMGVMFVNANHVLSSAVNWSVETRVMSMTQSQGVSNVNAAPYNNAQIAAQNTQEARMVAELVNVLVHQSPVQILH